MRKNASGQVIGAQMVNASSGAAFTGSVTVYVTVDGGTQAVGSVGSGACTHEGNGFHTYAPAQAETNGDHVAFTFIGSGAVPATVQVYPSFPQTGDAFARIGAPVGASISADIAGVQSDTNDIQTRLPAALVGGRIDANVGAISSDATAADNLEAALDGTGGVTITAALTGNITGNLSGSVGSVTGNVGGNVTGSVGSVATGGITATSIAADAIGASELAADAVSEIATGVWAAATRTLSAGTNIVLAKGTGITGFNDLDAAGIRTAVGLASANLDTQLDALPTNAELSTALGTADDAILAVLGTPAGASLAADVAAVKAQTAAIETDTQDIQGRLPAALVSGRIDASVGAMAANVMTAAAAAADLTTELQSGLATASALSTLTGYVDTEVAAIKAVTDKLDTAVELDGSVYRFTTNALEQAPSGGGGLTLADIADAVWDEAISGHLTSGTTGAALNAAGSAGDPWSTPLPGAYGSGTAGKIIGDNLNATVSSRATQTSVDTLAGYVDTEVAAIKAKTDALPADPADASDIAAAFSTVNTKLDTIDDLIDTEVAAIKAKTDLIPAAPAAVGDIPTALQNADALLNRDMSAVSDTNARSPLNALRFIRNKWTISGTTLSVKKEDDSTEAWTATVSTTPGADPVTGNDPA